MPDVEWKKCSRMSSWGSFSLFLILISLLVNGCTAVAIKPEKAVSHQKTQDILNALRTKEASIQNLKGLFRVSITGSILPLSKTLPGVVSYTRPDSIRLKGLTPVGGTFFQFVRDGEDYRLIMPASGRFTTGKIQELEEAGDIGQVVELSLRAMDAVLGKIKGLNHSTVQLYEEEDRFRIDTQALPDERNIADGVFMTRMWVEKQHYDIVHVEYLDQNGEVLRRIDCEDFRTVSSQVNSLEPGIQLPFHISAEDEQLSGSVTLDFQELVANAGS